MEFTVFHSYRGQGHDQGYITVGVSVSVSVSVSYATAVGPTPLPLSCARLGQQGVVDI